MLRVDTKIKKLIELAQARHWSVTRSCVVSSSYGEKRSKVLKILPLTLNMQNGYTAGRSAKNRTLDSCPGRGYAIRVGPDIYMPFRSNYK
jgi:hypothetical protein